MISEGSCDTEDWSNDAENSCHSMNKIHFKNENIPFFDDISQCYCFTVFYQINAAFGE